MRHQPQRHDRVLGGTLPGNDANSQINDSAALPLYEWVHLAVTVSGTTGTLYANGTPAGTNADLTLHPSNLGTTTQNWIGRSQYGDPLLNGTVDDFNVYGARAVGLRGRRP